MTKSPKCNSGSEVYVVDWRSVTAQWSIWMIAAISHLVSWRENWGEQSDYNANADFNNWSDYPVTPIESR